MLKNKMTVKEAIDKKIRFDRVRFIDKALENKTWFANSYYPTLNELVTYRNNLCQQSVIKDSEGFNKYSLIIWVNSNDPYLKNNFL